MLYILDGISLTLLVPEMLNSKSSKSVIYSFDLTSDTIYHISGGRNDALFPSAVHWVAFCWDIV